MDWPPTSRRVFLSRAAIALGAMAALNFDPPVVGADADPWTSRDVVQPGQLAAELVRADGSIASRSVYVGFRTLFEGGHIAGASFPGTASTPLGMLDLKRWATAIPQATNLVVYCGCCPFNRCPNIRPAFVALHGLGFTRLRVLVLPTNFATDWVDHGFPIAKGL
jgi:thiosulfate/3-mercaptopyruvate sulfurtransferase